MPVEVITGQDLRDWGGTDLRSALALAAGLDVAPGGDAGPASFVPEFWGLKEFDAFLLVVDGIPWGGAFNPGLTSLSLEDVERIEILRGAAPVMYGATSFVGVIHVVHRDAASARGNVSLSGGSYASGALRASAGLPVWAGFESAVTVDVQRQGFKDDRTEVRRGQVLWRNNRALGPGRFRFDVYGTWLDQDPASPHPRQGPALSAAVPLDANHNPDGAFLNERRVALSTGYDRMVGRAGWSTSVAFTRSNQRQFRGFLATLDPEAEARGIREDIEVTDLYVDTHFSWSRSPRLKFVAGADHLHGEGEARGADFDYTAPLDGSFAPLVGEPDDLFIGIGDRREFSGLYAFGEWNPGPRWRFEVGARLNRTSEKREGENEEEPPSPGEEEGNTRDDTRLSGSAAVSFTPWQRGSDRVRLFADYRNTFKPAAVDFGLEEGEEGEGGILKPETANSYEVGLKSRLAGNRLSLEVAAFQMDFKNLVVSQAINGLPSLTNAGAERFKGVEAAAAWRLPGHFSARATYSFHDARFRDFLTEFDGVPTQLAGKRLEMSARHLFSAGLLRAPEHGVLGAVELKWVGSRFLNKRNTALAEAYGTVSASLGYRAQKWEVRLDGRNLNDARDPVAESELGDAQYYRLNARRFDVTVSRRF
jgi:iron complex outermembrane receptor protein